MRQFIKAKESARLVVLGNEVIDSYAYIVPEGDFRSNTGLSPNVVLKRYSKEIEAVAIKAVQAMHLEVGGVDVIIDDRGEHYVMEVNFPFNFARAQNLTGTDVSGMMIDHLIKKTHLQNIGSNS
jgi:glutathione synthase/RimK-type ligase-like ATP-grasp enzyme